MKFLIFDIFNETFLEQSIWICKWVIWWSHRLTICLCILYIEILIFFFFLRCVCVCVCVCVCLGGGGAKTCKSTSPYRHYIRANILHLLRVDIRQVLLSHYLHYYLSDLHQIFTALCSNLFYSFYWLNLNLDRISPLTRLLSRTCKLFPRERHYLINSQLISSTIKQEGNCWCSCRA